MPQSGTSYTTSELAEIADGLDRLLGAIAAGDMSADAGTIARLEGASAAVRALAEGRRNPA